MQLTAITKYGFRIRTRGGLVVENLLIHGRDEDDAQRKLLQVHPGCEILQCICHAGNGLPQSSNFEDIVSLITR